jgi:formylglycine-generating enzyme required for sulfatase activity
LETKREWPDPRFPQKPDHPAVNLSWDDAQGFCAWLTERERNAGKLSARELDRLASDHEWSCAVGVGDLEDASQSPKDKNQKIADTFPWGSEWPPPPGAGNYRGEEGASKTAPIIRGYRDNFTQTTAVANFPANRFGLFDLGGNAGEWCEDRFDRDDESRVLRGAAFSATGREEILSSSRQRSLRTNHDHAVGVRIVLASTPGMSTEPAATRATATNEAAKPTSRSDSFDSGSSPDVISQPPSIRR